MKRKTFANLRTAALGLLLLEAMLLLVLLLIHTGASAEDSGFFGAPGEAAGFGDTASSSGGKSNDGESNHHGGSHHGGQSPYLCDQHTPSCLTGGDAVDAFASYGGRGQDFSGSGGGASGGGNGAGGNGGSGQDSANWDRPSWGFFPGGAGGGGFGGGNSGEGKSQSGGQDSDGQNGAQNGGQNNGRDGGSHNDGDGSDDANSPVIAAFISPDAGIVATDDPPPGAGDPPVNNDPDAPTPVPEPMTGSLLAAGLAAILVLRRQRRARS